jgi:hypothetical protein
MHRLAATRDRLTPEDFWRGDKIARVLRQARQLGCCFFANCLSRLAGMAGVEWRTGIVLDHQLRDLGGFLSSDFSEQF